MAISKEIKTGVMVVASLFIIIVGVYFLKGFNIFSSDKNYYCYFDNVEGLVPSATVQIKGYVIGAVKEVALSDGNKVRVTIAVNRKIKIPAGTTAALFSPDLMSGKSLRLDVGNGPSYLKDKDTIPTKVELGLLAKVGSQLDPVMANAQQVMLRLDSILVNVQNILDPQTKQNIQSSMASLDVTMKNFAALSTKLNGESDQLSGTIRNANSITSNFAKNNDNISGILSNLKSTTDQLSKSQLDQTLKELQATLTEAKGVMSKVNKGEGSLGQMVNDKQLYNNLVTSLNTLDKLIDDVNKHPSRYINIRLFGKAPKDNTVQVQQ